MEIRSSEGPSFDCYVALPRAATRSHAVVLACGIHGVDPDLRAIADDFASRGYIAAAPDLFWRTLPGPLERGDARAVERAEPRPQRIAAGEQDLRDVLRWLREQEAFAGRALAMGFCYGGPYAIIAPARLGYDAGMSCHGTAMLALVGEAAALRRPLCVLWGDEDRMAPPKVRQRYLEAERRSANLTVRIFPGVKHGYMMRASAAFDAPARDASFEVALRMLRQLELGDRSSPAAGTP